MTTQTNRSAPRWNIGTISRLILVLLICVLAFRIYFRSQKKDEYPAPLMEFQDSIRRGNVENVRRLLDKKIDLNQDKRINVLENLPTDTYPDRAYQILKMLLDYGVDPNSCAIDSPLVIMVRDDPKIVKLLLDRGAAANAKDSMGRNALMYCGNEKSMRLLIDAGADIHTRGYEGETPLMTTRSPAAIFLLLNEGARLDETDDNGLTAFLHAAKWGSKETVQCFIRKGANLHAVDKQGRDALFYALENPDSSIGEFLLSKGLKHRPNAARDSELLLSFANYPKDKRRASFLLHCGIDINVQDSKGDTALLRATIIKNDSLVKQIQANRYSRSTTRNRLARAVRQFTEASEIYEDAVEFLLDKGANPNQANKEGLSPLMAAVSNNNAPMVKTLLSHGANRNIKSRIGTQLDIAQAYGFTEVEQLLKQK